MNKYILVFFVLLSSFCLAENIDLFWEKPDITSQNNLSILAENNEPDYDNLELKYLNDKNESYFALENWQIFKKAVNEFLFKSGKPHNFWSLHKHLQHSNVSFKSFEILPGKPKVFWKGEETTKYGFDLSLKTGFDFVTNQDEHYSFIYYGIHLNGYLSRKLFFYTDFWAGHFSGDEPYFRASELIDSCTLNSDDNTQVFLDNVQGKLLYQIKPYWSASMGRGKYEIGNNIGGSIILNDTCNDYGYFATKFDFEKFYIHFLHASLIADSTKTDDKDFPDKYLATHKFGWKPNKKLEIFWGEHVIYGDRSIDLSYLLPFNYWRGTEHNLANRDNVLIFGGINFRPFKHDVIYFNAIFDEFSKSKFFGDWWGNKYAFQMGNSYQLNQNKENRLTFEFTAIRPWLYTHFIIQNKFSNDDISLGFPKGSNLINFASELNWKFRRNLSVNLHLSFTRQGSVGNDFSINYDTRPSDHADWLEGEIIDYKNARFVVDWQPLEHHQIKIGFDLMQIDDNDFEQEIILGYQASY